MKTLKVEFKVRYVGHSIPNVKTELVDVESDSTLEEQDQQLGEYYNENYVYGNSSVAQTYPYVIKS